MNRRKNDFNYSRLCEIVSRLNSRLLEIVKRDRKGLISDKEIVLVEKNEEMEDCYNSLSFQYIREVKRGGYCLVCINIEFTGERNSSSNCFVGTPNQIRRQFSFKKGDQFVRDFVDRMIYECLRIEKLNEVHETV